MIARTLSLFPLHGIPDIAAGDDLAELILQALEGAGKRLERGDVIVVAQKIVSKAEGRLVRLADVMPSPRAVELAGAAQKDPRQMELLLAESREVLRARPGVVIVEDRRGLVLANAGIDASNVAGEDMVLLLPEDPDASAARLRDALHAATGVAPAVLVTDSIGRAWRQGTIGTAIGAAGMQALMDLRGKPDMHGRPLQTTEVGHADEVAAAASLVMGQADERCPVVLVRGLAATEGDGKASDLLRPKSLDMFR